MIDVPTRIALVHSFYDEAAPSGENLVVEAQLRALRRAGRDIELFAVRTSATQREPLFSLRAAARVATGIGRAPDDLANYQPDVVHVHNLFPNYGRRWVRDLDAPLVVTLHNYRPICPQPMLFRDGAVCTLCPDGRRWSSFRYACYRDDRLRTLPLTLSVFGGPMSDPLLDAAARILVMNEKMADIYAGAGVPNERMTVAPNFLSDELDPGQPGEETRDDTWLFVGRLGREKGILRLLEAWPDSHRLRIVGAGGEDEQAVREHANGDTIQLLGRLPRPEVLELMRTCRGLVFPSIWYEGSPLVYAEALASGLPVLAFEPNSLARTVERDGTGMAARWDEDIARVLRRAGERFEALGPRCREVFEARYSEAAFLERTLAVYRDVSGGGRPR